MMDLRYHVVSLIGIFLALSVGFAMGTALTGARQPEGAFSKLKQQFKALSEQDDRINAANQRLQHRLGIWARAGRELSDAAVRQRLAGHRVAVIVCGTDGMPAYWPDLRATLELSGAMLGPVTHLPDEPIPVTPGERQEFTAFWGGEEETGIAGKYEAVGWLLKAMSLGGYGQRIDALARATGIRLEGSYSEPVRRILVLSAPPDADRAARAGARNLPEFALIAAADPCGVRVVFGEEETADVSLAAYLAARNATTVDDVDTLLGQTAAIIALDGAAGTFGVKPGASGPLPPLGP